MTPEEIKSRREALGYTQKELGEALGVTERTIGRWETGTTNALVKASETVERIKALGPKVGLNRPELL